MLPIIGITADQHENRYKIGLAYATAVIKAGGIPLILPPIVGMESHYVNICDGFVFTGGDDPIMEEWGIATHVQATPVAAERQAFDLALLNELQRLPNVPVLGVCLGMQWMCLLADGTLEQDLTEPFASYHKSGEHPISGALGNGTVHTNHHQAMATAGSLDVIALADDGVIEAVQDVNRLWYIGVQWHPERTEEAQLGQGLFNQLVKSSTKKQASYS
jgi:putative glutamine amidotransferase